MLLRIAAAFSRDDNEKGAIGLYDAPSTTPMVLPPFPSISPSLTTRHERHAEMGSLLSREQRGANTQEAAAAYISDFGRLEAASSVR